MIKLPNARESKIQFLVSRKFPEIYPWANRRIDPKLASLSELQSGAREYAKQLSRKSDAELGREYEPEKAKAAEEARAIADLEEAKRPYNQPIARANVDHWAKMSYWTPDEAVALSLGRAPQIANWPTVQQLVRVSPFAREFAARREIVKRAKAMGQLWDYTIPSMFLAWAERMRIVVPEELVEAVTTLGKVVGDWKTLFEQQKELTEAAEANAQQIQEHHTGAMRKRSEFVQEMRQKQDEIVSGYTSMLEQYRVHSEALEAKIAQLERGKSADGLRALGTRERESLLKLVIGMAVGGYGHNPSATRTDTASTVASDLQRAGLSLDEDTVRKYLAEAKELLSGETE